MEESKCSNCESIKIESYEEVTVVGGIALDMVCAGCGNTIRKFL